MNAVQDLLTLGAQFMQAKDEERRRLEAQRQAADAQIASLHIEAVRNALGLDDATFFSFQPVFKPGGYGVILTYLGKEINFSVNIDYAGNCKSVLCEKAPVLEGFATALVRITDWYNGHLEECLDVLNSNVSLYTTSAMNYAYARRISPESVWCCPAVRQARASFLLLSLTEPGVLFDPSAVSDLLAECEQLVDVACIGLMLPVIRAILQQLKAKQSLLHLIDRGTEVTDDDVDQIVQLASENGLSDDPDVSAAIAGRQTAIDNQQTEALAEEERQRLERESFRPFVYYVVNYAILTTDDDGERIVDTDSFTALSDLPGADGYWTTVGGGKIKPNFVVSIEKLSVTTLSQYLRLRAFSHFKRDTVYGQIAVVPANAEFIGG